MGEISDTLPLRYRGRVGRRVRVLSGPCAGAIGTIETIDVAGHVRVRFEPPARVPAVGRISSVWRAAIQVEDV